MVGYIGCTTRVTKGELELERGGNGPGGMFLVLTNTAHAKSQCTFTAGLTALQSALVNVQAGAHATTILRQALVLRVQREKV